MRGCGARHDYAVELSVMSQRVGSGERQRGVEEWGTVVTGSWIAEISSGIGAGKSHLLGDIWLPPGIEVAALRDLGMSFCCIQTRSQFSNICKPAPLDPPQTF